MMADQNSASETKPETKEAAPAKKLWSDEDFGEVDISGLKVVEPESAEDIVDQPERIKSESIVEPEEIKKVW